jgi:putative iron-only hydrogenase system regulator
MLMEKRIGAALILIEDKDCISKLNTILSNHSSIILARQGLPLRDKGVNVISLVLEGTTDEIGSLTGQLGRLKGLQVKSVLTKYNLNDEKED